MYAADAEHVELFGMCICPELDAAVSSSCCQPLIQAMMHVDHQQAGHEGGAGPRIDGLGRGGGGGGGM